MSQDPREELVRSTELAVNLAYEIAVYADLDKQVPTEKLLEFEEAQGCAMMALSNIRNVEVSNA